MRSVRPLIAGVFRSAGADRAFDNRTYRSARAEQHYTLKGRGLETYAPLFTFFGFRYARVTATGGAMLQSIH